MTISIFTQKQNKSIRIRKMEHDEAKNKEGTMEMVEQCKRYQQSKCLVTANRQRWYQQQAMKLINFHFFISVYVQLEYLLCFDSLLLNIWKFYKIY